MRQIPPLLFSLLASRVNGDLGPYTFYTSTRKKLVIFPKTWPKDPATYHQNLYRLRWRHAAARWQSLSQTLRDKWETMAKKAHLTITGYNLFIYYILDKNIKTVETVQRQSGMNVIDETGPPIPFNDVV